jgi:hypothetical protein
MPSLKKMLQAYDHDLIGRISSFWGVDSANLEFSSAVEALCQSMEDTSLAVEMVESLAAEARQALGFLAANPQKVTWAQFTRIYGEVREYGPAGREREEPELHPISIAEMLWYRGFIGKAFMNLPPEPREFAFIPVELISFAASEKKTKLNLEISPIPSSSIKKEVRADSRLVDHMVDWLAAKRMGRPLPEKAWKNWHSNEKFMTAIASEGGLVDQKGEPLTESLPNFFQQDREEILANWLTGWLNSTKINELKALPGLSIEGNWQNDPLRPRKFLLETIKPFSSECWYSLDALVNTIKSNSPDFQRPSGDYDSWFIRKSDSETFLRGFEHWDDVDGALIRYLVCGPLHWLGMIDIGVTKEKTDFLAFRPSPLLNKIVHQQEITAQTTKETSIKISPEMEFTIPLFAPRMLRYQIARFCEIDSISSEETCYIITPASLKSAQEAGLKLSQLIQLLEKQLKTPLPKSLLLLADRWEKHGLEIKFEKRTIFRAQSPEVLQTLQQNTHTAKYILEVLTPTTAIINQQGIKTIRRTLMEQGLLAEVDLEV